MTSVGRKELRLAVQSWIKSANIASVGQVYKAPPWWIGGPTFTPPAGELYSAALFVQIDRGRESRISLPAPDPQAGRSISSGFVGAKNVTYGVSIGIIYRYLIPPGVLDPVNGPLEDDWIVGLDKIIDALKDRLRTDPLIGTTSTNVFQVGQSENGISDDQDGPSSDGAVITCWAAVRFTAEQIITA